MKSIGKRIIGVKKIFKIKDEQHGKRYKSRDVIKGFMQVPGVDFTEYFAPVAKDSTIRTSFAFLLKEKNWTTIVVDVEAAFLNPKTENEMYIEWPEGIIELRFLTQKEKENYCIKIKFSMYGSVDAAFLWLKLFTKTVTKEMNYNLQRSKVDPCLYFKKGHDQKVMIMVIVYVDDTIICGQKEEVKKFKEEFVTKFELSEQGELRKHLEVWYEFGADEHGKYLKASMNEMVKSIIQQYKK